MKKIYRLLGKRGRITIPQELRMQLNYAPNDLLSFESLKDGSILIRREHISGAQVDGADAPVSAQMLLEFVDSWDLKTKLLVLGYLMQKQRGERRG